MFQIVDDTHASLRQKSVEVNPIDEETKKIVPDFRRQPYFGVLKLSF